MSSAADAEIAARLSVLAVLLTSHTSMPPTANEIERAASLSAVRTRGALLGLVERGAVTVLDDDASRRARRYVVANQLVELVG